MVGADIGRAALLALIPLGVALGFLDLPVLAGVAFGVGALTVVFDVCYVSVLPSLIGREQLQSGNAALESSRAVASIAWRRPRSRERHRRISWFGTIPVGAVIGGWLGGTTGFRPTLALCAAGALLTVGFPLSAPCVACITPRRHSHLRQPRPAAQDTAHL